MEDKTPSQPFEEYQSLLEFKLDAEVNYVRSLIEHRGERGRLVENVLKRILENHLPETFGVKTGFAIDQHGVKSKQLDLIIYDKAKCFFLLDEDVAALPVEAVILVIEVKSDMNSNEFLDVLRKAESVSSLDRSAYVPQAVVIKGPHTDLNGRHRPIFLGVSLNCVDPNRLLVKAAEIGCTTIDATFISMDGKCLVNQVNHDGEVGWGTKTDYPASALVLLVTMIATQAIMVPIDITKYLKIKIST